VGRVRGGFEAVALGERSCGAATVALAERRWQWQREERAEQRGWQNGWVNEMKRVGKREKGNARFPNPPYINQLTDEYRWAVPVSHVPHITDEYMPCHRRIYWADQSQNG
jgi:hypothetical protein